jgi:geranylgeranyl diphosphate synthase type I
VIEGQHLDLSFEDRQEISVSMYLQMITRKTAALMECAAEMGALLGTSEQQVIDRLRQFGLALGVAFQLRDDLLGIWATRTQSGKTPAGDLYRRKKTLPVLYALQQTSSQGQAFLRTVYQQKEPLSPQQVARMLEILEQTQSRAFCQQYLAEQCQRAHEVLAGMPRVSAPIAQQAFSDLETLLFYIREDAGTP